MRGPRHPIASHNDRQKQQQPQVINFGSVAPEPDQPFKRQLGSEPLPIPPYRLTIDYSQSLNLLLIQQAAATIIPRQTDWPSPRLPVYPVHQLVPNLLTSTLGFVQAPLIPTDWQNPAPLNRPHSPQYPPNLLISTLAVPFKQDDWSIPQIAKRGPAPQDSPNPGLTTRAAVPFLSKDWPNPLPKPPTVNPQDKPNPLLTTMAAVPFLSKDWPNPQIPPRPHAARNEPNPLLTTTAPVPVLRQTDWPNPRISARTATQQDYSSLLTTTLATVQAAPFKPVQWPNPIVGRATFGDAVVNLHLSTLAVPFRQTEWFNPPNPIRITQSHEAPNLLLTTLAVAQVAPFKPSDWPLPSSAPRQPEHIWAGRNTALLSTPVAAAPFFMPSTANPPARMPTQEPFQQQDTLFSTLGPPPQPLASSAAALHRRKVGSDRGQAVFWRGRSG